MRTNILPLPQVLVVFVTTLAAFSMVNAVPEGPRPVMQADFLTEEVDGIEYEWVRLTAANVRLTWYPVGNWVLSESHGPDVSTQFHNRSLPEHRMQLILYPEGTWLNDLSEASIEAYIEKVSLQFPDHSLELLNPETIRPPLGSAPFLGSAYRKIFYRLSPLEETADPVFEFIDVLAITQSDALLVLRFTGPPRMMEYQRQNLGSDLASFAEF